MFVLYVFVDTDLSSMNPGKAQAHSGHAVSAFMHSEFVKPLIAGSSVIKSASNWAAETNQGFGTQINLKIPKNDFDDVVSSAIKAGYSAELVTDPTYPYIVNSEVVGLIDSKIHTQDPVEMKSGDFCLFRKEVTAGYVFGDNEDLDMINIMSKFKLHD